MVGVTGRGGNGKEKNVMEGEAGESSDDAGSKGDSNESEEENDGGVGECRTRPDDASGLNRTLGPARVREKGVRVVKSTERVTRVCDNSVSFEVIYNTVSTE